MAIGTAFLLKKLERYFNKELRYHLNDDELLSVLFRTLSGEEAAISNPSRDAMVIRYATKFLYSLRLDFESTRTQLMRDYPYSDPVLRELLPQAINALEDCEGKPQEDQLTLLNEHRLNPVLRDIFYWAYNWKLVFHFRGTQIVSEIHKNEATPGRSAENASRRWIRFTKLLRAAARRSQPLSEIAQTRMLTVLMRLPVNYRKWACRILDRNLHFDDWQTLVRQTWSHRLLPPSYAPNLSIVDGLSCRSSWKSVKSRLPDNWGLLPMTTIASGALVYIDVWSAKKKAGAIRRTNDWIEYGSSTTITKIVSWFSDKLVNTGKKSGVLLATVEDNGQGMIQLYAVDIIPRKVFERGIGVTTLAKRRNRLAQIVDEKIPAHPALCFTSEQNSHESWIALLKMVADGMDTNAFCIVDLNEEYSHETKVTALSSKEQ